MCEIEHSSIEKQTFRRMTWIESTAIEDQNQGTANMSAVEALDTFCPVCREAGMEAKLRMFQINFKEAVWLCSQPKCTYPMGLEPSQNIIVNRDVAEATFSKKRKVAPKATEGVKKRQKTMASVICPSSNSQVMACVRKHLPQPTVIKPVNQSCAEPIKSAVVTSKKMPFEVEKSAPATEAVSSECVLKSSKLENKDITVSSSVKNTSCRSESSILFPQWKNSNNLCWLDAMLCLLVHSSHINSYCTSENTTDSQLVRLVKAYRNACDFYALKTDSVRCNEILLNNIVDGGHAFLEQENGQRSMHMARKNMWLHLQPKLRCVAGKEDSAACGLMALLSTEPPELQQKCGVTYDICATCIKCGTKQKTELHKRVLVFPPLSSKFSMMRPLFYGSCSHCQSTGQPVTMTFKNYPDVFLGHFIGGLPGTALAEHDFHSPDGARYQIKGVIRYKRSPDHFVTWIRNGKNNHWMECDDLGPTLCEFRPQPPGFPLKEVHIAMWERVGDVNEPQPPLVNTVSPTDVPLPERKVKAASENPIPLHVSKSDVHKSTALHSSASCSDLGAKLCGPAIMLPPKSIRLIHAKTTETGLKQPLNVDRNTMKVLNKTQKVLDIKNKHVKKTVTAIPSESSHSDTSATLTVSTQVSVQVDVSNVGKRPVASKIDTRQSSDNGNKLDERKNQNSTNVKSSKADEAAASRIKRMQQKFLQDRNLMTNSSRAIPTSVQKSVTKTSTMHTSLKQNDVSTKSSVNSVPLPSSIDLKCNTNTKTEKEAHEASGSTNTLNRVLKYLPKSNSLHHSLSALQQASKPAITPKPNLDSSSKKSKTFSGYVPKAASMNSLSSIPDEKESTETSKNESMPRGENLKKKNVKFVLGDDEQKANDITRNTPRTASVANVEMKKPGKSVLVSTNSPSDQIVVTLSPKTLETLNKMSPKKIPRIQESSSTTPCSQKIILTSPKYVMGKKREAYPMKIPGIKPLPAQDLQRNNIGKSTRVPIVKGFINQIAVQNNATNMRPSQSRSLVVNLNQNSVLTRMPPQNRPVSQNGTDIHHRTENGPVDNSGTYSSCNSQVRKVAPPAFPTDTSQDQRVPDSSFLHTNNHHNSAVIPDFLEANIAKHNLLAVDSLMLSPSQNNTFNLFNLPDSPVKQIMTGDTLTNHHAASNKTAVQQDSYPQSENGHTFEILAANQNHEISSHSHQDQIYGQTNRQGLLSPPLGFHTEFLPPSPFNKPLLTSSPVRGPMMMSPPAILRTPPSLSLSGVTHY